MPEIDPNKKRWLGLKIAVPSFLACILGSLVVWFGFVDVGRVILVLGIVGGFLGVAIHFYGFIKVRGGLRPETDEDKW